MFKSLGNNLLYFIDHKGIINVTGPRSTVVHKLYSGDPIISVFGIGDNVLMVTYKFGKATMYIIFRDRVMTRSFTWSIYYGETLMFEYLTMKIFYRDDKVLIPYDHRQQKKGHIPSGHHARLLNYDPTDLNICAGNYVNRSFDNHDIVLVCQN